MDVKSSKMDFSFLYNIGRKHVKVKQDRHLDIDFLRTEIQR